MANDYHRLIGEQLGRFAKGTEMITEIYVPRPALADFLHAVRRDFVENRVELIYGTIRLIERDDESFLAWARDPAPPGRDRPRRARDGDHGADRIRMTRAPARQGRTNATR